MSKGEQRIALKSLLSIGGLGSRDQFVILRKMKDLSESKKTVSDWIDEMKRRKIFEKTPDSLAKLKS